MDTQEKRNDYMLPLSIVIAAVLIAGSWIYTTGLKNANPTPANPNTNQQANVGATNSSDNSNIVVNPVTSQDHIRGNANAPVKVIEFSDLECPFCKMFQATMQQVMKDYGASGQVAWIYREYPIASLHSKAPMAAEAAECAADLGGNDKFWAYIDKYYQTTPSNNQIEIPQITQIGVDVGLDKTQLQNCINSNKFQQKISDSIADGTKAGLQGTPYSVVLAKDGRKLVINGAEPYDQVKALIEDALK